MPEPAWQKDTVPHHFPPLENTEASLDFLRKAINAPDIPMVKHLIKEGIADFNVLNKIELTIGETVKMLKDEARHYLFADILAAVNQNLPAALIGPAGSGKSTIAEQVAEALDIKPFFLQNAVGGTHELTGFNDAHGRYITTAFRQAFEFGGTLFLDEMDASDASALKWMNTAIANGYAMFPDKPERLLRHLKFRIIAAANTFGNGADRIYVGANQIDASTLDRFVFFYFDYDEKLEQALSGNIKWAERVQVLRKAAQTEKARVVISPRASINGAKLLAIGWAQEKVEDSVIWKGMDPELKTRILDTASGKKKQSEIDELGATMKKKKR